jgi:hypothetical protein
MYAKMPPVWRMTKAHTIDAGSIKNSTKKKSAQCLFAYCFDNNILASWIFCGAYLQQREEKMG